MKIRRYIPGMVVLVAFSIGGGGGGLAPPLAPALAPAQPARARPHEASLALPPPPRPDAGRLPRADAGTPPQAPLSGGDALQAIAGRLAVERPSLPPAVREAIAGAITLEAGRRGIDPWLVYSVVAVESGFEPRSVGSAGERGLMQVLPSTARAVAARHFGESLHRDQLFDPHTNIRIGTAYLAELLAVSKGDPARALTAYNTGGIRGAPNGYARRVLARYRQVSPAVAGGLPAGGGRKTRVAVEGFRS